MPLSLGHRALLLVVLAALALPLWVQAQQLEAGELSALDEYVSGAMAAWNAPGLALAVVADDAVVFSRGYGVREVGHPDPVDVVGPTGSIWSSVDELASVTAHST
jgi:CubicO group peptidase (beta-lactamase class C family)